MNKQFIKVVQVIDIGIRFERIGKWQFQHIAVACGELIGGPAEIRAVAKEDPLGHIGAVARKNRVPVRVSLGGSGGVDAPGRDEHIGASGRFGGSTAANKGNCRLAGVSRAWVDNGDCGDLSAVDGGRGRGSDLGIATGDDDGGSRGVACAAIADADGLDARASELGEDGRRGSTAAIATSDLDRRRVHITAAAGDDDGGDFAVRNIGHGGGTGRIEGDGRGDGVTHPAIGDDDIADVGSEVGTDRIAERDRAAGSIDRCDGSADGDPGRDHAMPYGERIDVNHAEELITAGAHLGEDGGSDFGAIQFVGGGDPVALLVEPTKFAIDLAIVAADPETFVEEDFGVIIQGQDDEWVWAFEKTALDLIESFGGFDGYQSASAASRIDQCLAERERTLHDVERECLLAVTDAIGIGIAIEWIGAEGEFLVVGKAVAIRIAGRRDRDIGDYIV